MPPSFKPRKIINKIKNQFSQKDHSAKEKEATITTSAENEVSSSSTSNTPKNTPKNLYNLLISLHRERERESIFSR
ncbi:MAG: hypothetical protein MRECE_34c001 [Mycoplasmataceae bacterium CE_OT135]|nr:MAG: hypothetical protein MRECE_34c001 [Mycoplasmataceae bacterium CE_OT135]